MNLPIAERVPLAPYTTFHIGGEAEFFVSIGSVGELREAVTWARERALPIIVLGGGSNMLVSDDGVRGLVVRVAIEGVAYEEDSDAVRALVGAGVTWDDFVADTVARGYWGLENLSAIPGTVGATPVQNVGAYGVEVASRIERVEVFDAEACETASLSADECAFGYRDSVFKHPEGRRYIVTAVTFTLSKTPAPVVSYADLAARFAGDAAPSQQAIRDAVREIRSRKFPDWTVVGTAGSFFKNPIVPQDEYEALKGRFDSLPGFPDGEGRVKIPLGWILDRVLRLRGACDGDVCAYEQQALVIVNRGNATARDVDAFARGIEQKVFDATGIPIEREVRMIA